MRKCASCGRETMDEAKFCQFCGSKFSIEENSIDNDFQSQNVGNEAPPLPDVSRASNFDVNQNVTPPPNNGLVWLIISSILAFFGCICYGLGLLQVPTIITSAISVSKYNSGDYEGSQRMAKTSMILFFSLLALSIIIIIVIVVGLVSFAGTSDFADIVEEFY